MTSALEEVEALRERMAKPYIRCTLKAPPGDRLISRKEAAFLLGVPAQSVSALVMRGRLFGWQEIPGRQGCPLWLS